MKAFQHSVCKPLAWLAAAWLLGTAAGCVPRYFEKTPVMALRYPNVPVDSKELANFKALVAISPNDPQAVKARFWIAQDAYNRGQYVQAEKQFQALAKQFPRSEWAAPSALMAARSQVLQQKRLAGLASLGKLQAAHPSPSDPYTAAAAYARQLIDRDLNETELAQVKTTYPNHPWGQQAMFVSAKRNLDAGNADAAMKEFQDFLAAYPESEFASMARELMTKAVRLVPLNRYRIGCLLPLSGPYAFYGSVIRQGLELALQDLNRERPAGEQLGLVVADSQGTTESAVAGLRRLAEAEKVMAVVGPVLSSDVKALLPEIARWHIPLITPSAGDPELAGVSPFFFRYMLTNQQQGEAMAEYIVLRKNFLKVGILNGETPYDRSLAEAFEARIVQLGGEVVARVEYPAGQTDFKAQMVALGGVDPSKIKDADVQERKALERIMETVAHGVSRIVAPDAQPENERDPKQPPAAPDKRVVIVRFSEEGEQAQKDSLGKTATEKLSYALAVKPGVTVLTQDQTFKALKKLGLSSLGLDDAAGRSLAEELQADYLIVGQVREKVSEAGTTAPAAASAEIIPIRYTIGMRLLRPRGGGEIKSYSHEWTKSIPAQSNVRGMEAIYLPVSAGDAVLIASQLDFYDLKPAVFGSDSWVTPKLLREGAEVLEGATLATGFWSDDSSGRTPDFVKAFETAFSATPSLLAVQAYDILHLVGQVLKGLNLSQAQREDFQRKLIATKRFTGVTGPAAVGQDGEIRRDPIFLEVSNGQFQRIR